MVPKDYASLLEPAKKLEFSMLGLGDIVVPGLFIALALRYDLYRFHLSHPQLPYKRHMYSFPKPYFVATFTAYILGLVLTMTVMHVFRKAQPALLYLSPACAFSVLVLALVKKDLPGLWAYKEISKEDRLEKEAEEKKKEKEKPEAKEKAEGQVEDGEVKYEAQAIRKKTGAVEVSGDGGDVESLDDLTAEDGEGLDSEWTQGGGEGSDEVHYPDQFHFMLFQD
jgi:minor histocompatibility antigen H13